MLTTISETRLKRWGQIFITHAHNIWKQNLPFFLPTVHSLLKSRTVSLESTLTNFPHGRPLP